jgi:hypothetical protein
MLYCRSGVNSINSNKIIFMNLHKYESLTLYGKTVFHKKYFRSGVNSINSHKHIFMNLHKYESRLMSKIQTREI